VCLANSLKVIRRRDLRYSTEMCNAGAAFATTGRLGPGRRRRVRSVDGSRDTAARATLTPRSPQRTSQHRPARRIAAHVPPARLGLAGAPLAGYAAGRNGTFFATEVRSAWRSETAASLRDADSFTYHYTAVPYTRCALRMSL
jgi:hypothetical protein